MDLSKAPMLALPIGVSMTLLTLALALLGIISLISASYLAGSMVQITSLILTHAQGNRNHTKKNRPAYVI